VLEDRTIEILDCREGVNARVDFPEAIVLVLLLTGIDSDVTNPYSSVEAMTQLATDLELWTPR
jgi:hypothetical protein